MGRRTYAMQSSHCNLALLLEALECDLPDVLCSTYALVVAAGVILDTCFMERD